MRTPHTRGAGPGAHRPDLPEVVAIRTEDKDKPWGKDLSDAYRSREFLAVTDTKFPGFAKTDYQRQLLSAK